MGWQSHTQIVTVPVSFHGEFWEKIRKLSEKRLTCDEETQRNLGSVCCYFAQGSCWWGSKCVRLHDLDQLQTVGCSLGSRCVAGHTCFAKPVADDIAGPQFSRDLVAELSRPGFQHFECHGPGYDDSDPLWEEICVALQEESELICDTDLSVFARERLNEEGRYALLDDATADEWLCLPAHYLLQRIKAAMVDSLPSRSKWLGYDMTELNCFWEQLLRSGDLLTKEEKFDNAYITPSDNTWGQVSVGESALQRHIEHLTSSIADIKKLLGVGSNIYDAPVVVDAEILQSEALEHVLVDALHALKEVRVTVESAASVDLDKATECDIPDILNEMQTSFERCLWLQRAARADAVAKPVVRPFAESRPRPELNVDSQSTDSDATERTTLDVRTEVVIDSVPDAEDAIFVGKRGRLEHYDRGLKVWQLRMSDCGTRLHLPAGRFRVLKPKSTSRSRSPRLGDRKLEGPASLLQMVKAAAIRNDVVFIHHHVPWHGSDSEENGFGVYDSIPWWSSNADMQPDVGKI